MKINILAILIGAALICGAVIFYYPAHKNNSAPEAIGSKVLPNLPVNQVAKIVITSKDGVNIIAKSKDKWVVASRFNYPANFDKVADIIRELSELKIGQTVHATPAQLGSFNLIGPNSSGTNRQAESGTLLELRDEKDGFLASLLVGKKFMRKHESPSMEDMMGTDPYADGQYVRSADGKVYLVARSLARMTEPAKNWLADNFIDAPSAEIKEITLSGPGRETIELARAKENNAFTLNDLRPEEGSIDVSKINQMSGALNRLGFDDVVDPAISLKETGLDHPVVFKAATKDGLIYTLQIGNTLTNDTFDRYLMIFVTNAPPSDQQATDKPKGKEEEKAPERKDISEQASALNKTFGPWIYVIKSYRAEPLLLTRNDLVKKTEPPKAEAAQTNAPQINAGEIENAPLPPAKKKHVPSKNSDKGETP